MLTHCLLYPLICAACHLFHHYLALINRVAGFTFLAPAEGDGDEDEEDEVTVTFKGAMEAGATPKIDADMTMVSYIKEVAREGAFGSVGDAAMQLAGANSQAVVAQGLTFEAVCLALAIGVAITFAARNRCRRSPGALLPVVNR